MTLLVAVIVLILPGQGIQASGTQKLVFDTRNGSDASIMNIAKNNSSVYEPSKKVIDLIVTSYNSEPGQTDATPTITAFGTHVRDGIIATNYLPKGTRVRFPDLYGDKVFVVEDRMNIRYTKRADIWSADKEFSRQFGARYLRMEVL